MNYEGKKIAITGATGFIGGRLATSLGYQSSRGAHIQCLQGDIRDSRAFASLDHTFDYLFHFASPSSQVLFKRKPQYCIEITVKGFMNAADACRDSGVRLIYPSTGLLSMGEVNEYARCKRFCEDYAAALNIDSLGIRIFAGYGPGEGHKADYASVPYLFADSMAKGQPPVIFGDGTQSRDFIYIHDIVDGIMTLAETCPEKVIDLGSGRRTSFNLIVRQINEALGTKIKPRYVEAPSGYVEETLADITKVSEYYTPQYTLEEGIKLLVSNLDYLKSSSPGVQDEVTKS